MSVMQGWSLIDLFQQHSQSTMSKKRRTIRGFPVSRRAVRSARWALAPCMKAWRAA
jgi:hypothetical protein